MCVSRGGLGMVAAKEDKSTTRPQGGPMESKNIIIMTMHLYSVCTCNYTI